jgi:hypothetical protein
VGEPHRLLRQRRPDTAATGGLIDDDVFDPGA